MAKGKSPAFQFYAADWLSSKSVKLMTNQERGIYIQLLAHEWLDKGLPMDPESLAKLADEPLESFKLAWEKVGKCFLRKDGKYHNPRLRKERAKKREFSEKMRENAEKLWRTPSKPKHFLKDAESMPKVCSISSSSSSTSIPEDLLNNKDAIENWLAYKKEMRSQYTARGLNALWGRLRKIAPARREASIEASMAAGYKGIFESKDGGTNAKTTGAAPRVESGYDEYIKQN